MKVPGVKPFAALSALILLTPAAQALDLTFPYPVLDVVSEPAEFDSYALPIGAWTAGALPSQRVEGMVDRRALRIDAAEAGLLAVMVPLREQLVAQGYEVLLDCETQACGGFDFRFGTEVMAEPAMHVDLGEFRFLSARRGDQAVSLMISRSAAAVFVQVTTVGPEAEAPLVSATEAVVAPEPNAPVVAPLPEDLTARLDGGYGVALDDLVFTSGSSALAEGDYASLAALAGWLKSDAARRVLLVGHTDASGGLTANVALSEKRAAAVRAVLVSRHGVDAGQVEAAGAGPMAPRDTNATEEGRTRNRRVEAIPAPT